MSHAINAGEFAELLTASGIPMGSALPWDDCLRLKGVRSAARLPQSPASVLVCAFPYFRGVPEKRNLALYAMLPDYHTVVLGYLERLCSALREKMPGAQFVPFADASPVDELESAYRAGLGKRGDNGLIITPLYGTFVFLGEIVTDAVLPYGSPVGECEHCGACKRACPHGALSDDVFEKVRCLSHISQKKGVLTDEEAEWLRAGGLVWGCDRCQSACPHNRDVRLSPLPEFADVEPILTPGNLDRLMQNRAFAWRGRKVLERNMAIVGSADSNNIKSEEGTDTCNTKF